MARAKAKTTAKPRKKAKSQTASLPPAERKARQIVLFRIVGRHPALNHIHRLAILADKTLLIERNDLVRINPATGEREIKQFEPLTEDAKNHKWLWYFIATNQISHDYNDLRRISWVGFVIIGLPCLCAAFTLPYWIGLDWFETRRRKRLLKRYALADWVDLTHYDPIGYNWPLRMPKTYQLTCHYRFNAFQPSNQRKTKSDHAQRV